MRKSTIVVSIAAFVFVACDAEPKEGFFGESAAAPPPAANDGGDDDGGDDDADTEGASETGGAPEGSSGGGEEPPPPPVDPGSSGAPADDGGMDGPLDDGIDPAEGSSSGGFDDGVASTSVGDDGGVMPSGACCTPDVGVGCSDPAVEACVCAGDAFCCDTLWDQLCVDAASACGAACNGGGGGGGGACCMVQAGPGCGDAAIEGCVCPFDSFCCDTQWDDICVQEAIDCGAAC